MQDFTDTKPVDLYEAAIGEKNKDYYLEKFEAFDQQGPGLKVSWNWGAFLFGGFWALYRKMYGWFFAWWFVAMVVTIVQKIPNVERHLGFAVFVIVLWLGFSMFADALYYAKIKSRITAVAKSTSDAAKVDKRLRVRSGVNAWVTIVFGAVPVIGVVLAVGLPAYRDKGKGQIASSMQPAPRVATESSATVFVPFTGKLDEKKALTLVPFTGKLDEKPNFDSKGWTQETTNSTEVGLWIKYDPPGTRYWRDYSGIIYRVYPPGTKPNAEEANPFGLGSSEDFPR